MMLKPAIAPRTPDDCAARQDLVSRNSKPLLPDSAMCPMEVEAPATMADQGSVEAILDTGASRCVLGSVTRLLHQIPASDRRLVKEMPSSVRFRFGSNSCLTNDKRVLPLVAPNQQRLWLGVEIVLGRTPFSTVQKNPEATFKRD